jgi:hypothetical protein
MFFMAPWTKPQLRQGLWEIEPLPHFAPWISRHSPIQQDFLAIFPNKMHGTLGKSPKT